jgi:hypothetical protein
MKKYYILAALLCFVSLDLSAQCTVGSTEPPPLYGTFGYPRAWEVGLNVPFILYAGYITTQASGTYFSYWPTNFGDDIAAALTNWQFGGTNWFGSFVAGGTSVPLVRPWYVFYFVKPADLPSGASGGSTAGMQNDGTGKYVVVNASTSIRNDITNDHYMRHVAAHEIGHSFALGDCYFCSLTTTVMTSATIVFNDPSNGLLGPGPLCDVLQVNNTAYPF